MIIIIVFIYQELSIFEDVYPHPKGRNNDLSCVIVKESVFVIFRLKYRFSQSCQLSFIQAVPSISVCPIVVLVLRGQFLYERKLTSCAIKPGIVENLRV